MDYDTLASRARPPFLERNYDRAAWLSAAAFQKLIRRSRGGQQRYVDPATLAWTAGLEAGWREIRAELEEVLRERDSIPGIEQVSPHQEVVTNDRGWKVFVFSVFGTWIEKNCARCPRTAALLATMPGLRTSMFSILAPGKRLPEHCGPYAGLLRYHLGLKMPTEPGECSLTVDGERRTWAEGSTVIFDDTYPHSACNDTSQDRVVLLADFVRPLPAPLAIANRGVLELLAHTGLFREPIARLKSGNY